MMTPKAPIPPGLGIHKRTEGQSVLIYLTRPMKKSNADEVPVIRKVFRREGKYICGLCRTKHDHEDPALECLDTCWTETLNKSPVIETYDLGHHGYKCRFCCRIYQDLDGASLCASECLGLRKKHHYADMKLYEIPVAEFHMREKYTFATTTQDIKAEFISKFNFKRKKPEDEANEAEAQDAQTSEGGGEADSGTDVTDGAEPDSIAGDDQGASTESSQSQPAVARVRRKKADFAKQWIRANAKYECSVCKEQYYTRIETEQCFAKHFDSQGVEVFEDDVISDTASESAAS